MKLPKSLAVLGLLFCLSLDAATWISLGVFSSRDRANAFAQAQGAMVLEESVAGGGERFRVVLGPYPSRSAALEPLAEQREAHPDAWLIERSADIVKNRPVPPPGVAVRQEPKPLEPGTGRNHEDDEAPGGYGFHELRRSENRRE